ncbi:hypothetical protein AB0I10_32250 [Streptomyces sp. NPDC050636]|uniref:hypothetical protein n=1 Tax=Streptomyces sp. NPDC050636 TaxID=3154510 RepID=UPI0034444F92
MSGDFENSHRYRLSGVVMSHPSRLDSARQIVTAAPPGALSLVMDSFPEGPPSALRTALRAWSAIPADATHHLVVQDDMQLSDTLFDRAQRAVAAMPDAALALFSFWDSRNGGGVRLGALSGARWVGTVNEYTPTTALILPRAVAAGFVAYAQDRLNTWPDDILMFRYLRAAQVRTFVAVPNLAEHSDLPSLVGNTFRGPRKSACFLAHDPKTGAADEIPRSGVAARPPAVPFFKQGVAQCAVLVPGSVPPRWLHLTCEQYLTGLGVAVGRLRPRRCGSDRGLDPEAAWNTWLTAYTLGLVHRGVAHREGSVGPVDPVVRDLALATVGPGGVSQRMDQQSIDELQGRLADVAREGEAAGIADADAGRPRRRAKKPGLIAVAGGDTLLGEYIVQGLRDRGHRIALNTPESSVAPNSAKALVDLTRLPSDRHDPATDRSMPDTSARRTGGVATQPQIQIRFAPFGGDDSLHDHQEVLRFDELYGPGVSRHSLIGRMVSASLIGRPIVLDIDPGTRVQPVAVPELVEALSKVLDRSEECRSPISVSGPGMTLREIAEAVAQVVRPVRIDAPATVTDTSHPAIGVGVESSAAAVAKLAQGLHAFAQWLAYEAAG